MFTLPRDIQGAHFWLDKATRAAPSSADPFGDGRSGRAGVLDLAAVHGALSGAVRAAARRRRVVVIATKAAYAPPAPPAPPTPHGVPGAPQGGLIWRLLRHLTLPCQGPRIETTCPRRGRTA